MKKSGLLLLICLGVTMQLSAISLDHLPNHQDRGMKMYISGTQKLQDGDFVGALEDLTRAVRIRPDLAEAFHNLGFALEKTGDLRGAGQAYERALAIKPQYPSALNNLGYLLAVTETDIQRALLLCQRAVELEPSSATYRNSLGWANYKAGRIEQAMIHFRTAIKIDPTHFKAHFNLGLCEFNQKNYEAASRHFTNAIRINPNYLRAYIPLAYCFEKTQQNNKALHVYRQALARAPEGTPVRRHIERKVEELTETSRSFYFSNVKNLQGGSKASRFLQSRAAQGRISAPALQTNTLNAFESSGSFTPVRTVAAQPPLARPQISPPTPLPQQRTAQTTRISPESLNAGTTRMNAPKTTTIQNSGPVRLTVAQEKELEQRFSLSKSYLDRGLVQEAKQILEEIAAIGGNSTIVRQSRSQLLRVQRVLDDKTQAKAKIHLEMGKEFFRGGRFDMAEAEFRNCLRLTPNDAEAHKDLALLYFNLGRLEEAYEESKRAIALDRTIKEAYIVLGSLYARKGRIDEAIHILRRVGQVSESSDAVNELAEQMISSLANGG